MDSLGDLLKKKADDINIDAKLDDLDLIKTELKRVYKDEVKVQKLNKDGSLIITAKNSAVASEVRLNQVSIIDNLSSSLKQPVKRLIIRQF